MTSDDPFDTGVPRIGGKPQIIPLNGRGKPDPKKPLETYERASDIAGALDDGYGLRKWLVRHAVVGMAISPDLCEMAGALGRNPDTFDREAKANLDAIADRAHDRSGGNEKADYGTAIHSLTEPGNDGVIPDRMVDDVIAYRVTLDDAGLVVESTETFTVNDTLKVAGTFDHVYRTTKPLTFTIAGVEHAIPVDVRLIGDKKTGKLHVDQHGIQLATYARAKAYDHVTGERTALDVSPQWGIVAHIPREGGRAVLHVIDLAQGWEAAKLAVAARAYKLGAAKRMSAPVASYKVEPSGDDVPPPAAPAQPDAPQLAQVVTPAERDAGPVDAFGDPIVTPEQREAAALNLVRTELNAVDVIAEAIGQAADLDTLRDVWRKYHNHPAWTGEHAMSLQERVVELQAAA